MLCALGSLPERGPCHCLWALWPQGRLLTLRLTHVHAHPLGLSPATSVVFCFRSTLCSLALLDAGAGAWPPPLTRVVLWGCSFVSQANIFLRVLDISYNGCGDSGASAVAEALKTNNVLEELYMR